MTRKSTIHILITFIAILIYLPFLGAFHLFDWDEINFAEAAREMLVSKNWSQVQIGFEPFWEKPPLFIWLQASCMQIFGINEFAARLPSALSGIVTLNLLYHFGRSIIGHFAGIFWTLAFAGSLAPSLYFHIGIIDPVFNLFLFLSIHQLFKSELANLKNESARIHYLLAGFYAGLAVLTKGPVALLIVFLVGFVRLIANRKFVWPGFLNLFLFTMASFAIASLWVVPEIAMRGFTVLQHFIDYQITLFHGQIDWHNQPWFYHILVLLFLCFPSSIFAMPHLIKNTSFSGTEKLYASYMRATFWVVLILFSIVSTKIIHYSSMCWIPLGWFAGYSLYRKHTNRASISSWLFIPTFFIVVILGAATTLAPLAFTVPAIAKMLAQINDPTAQAILTQKIPWIGFEWLLGLVFIVACFWWWIRYKVSKKINFSGLFVITLLFSSLFWILILPKLENALQGKYINQIKEIGASNSTQESWGFKTYAIYFYGNARPEDFKGAWEKNMRKFNLSPSPKYETRVRYFMNDVLDKPVYIYTRINYKPDDDFRQKFDKKENLGAYIIWQRKSNNVP